MALRAVVCELDGVLVLPSLFSTLDHMIDKQALPRGFLNEILGGLTDPSGRLMRGEITYHQWVSLIDEDLRRYTEDLGLSRRENFSISQTLDYAISIRKINRPILQAVITLRKKGFITCIFSNNFLNDGTQRSHVGQLMCELKPHFDFVIDSHQVGMTKPNPQIYRFMLDTLKVSPKEVVYLDENKVNLKPACDMGMATIFFQDTTTALKELENVTGTQLLETAAPLPVSCKPSDMCNGYVPIKPGVRLHFVEMGSGPVVCLCHGFPESWFSWRYQIPALAQAGFRVLALDMKGYGESSAPPEIEEYSMEVMCEEMVIFLDKLGISQAVFIGHDWGSMVVWNMALFYPERVRAVASLNTPLRQLNPTVSPMEIIKTIPVFDYQLYFQEPGVAEAELEQNLSRTFRALFRAHDEAIVTTHRIREKGGILVGTEENPSLSKIVTEEDIQFYVQQFKKSGFRGPLNWYRNIDRNWKWGCKAVGRKILIPALMVVSENDRVLTPEMSKNMEDWIPNLKRGCIKDCGHWTQMEKPNELNEILTEWLKTDASDPSSLNSKL